MNYRIAIFSLTLTLSLGARAQDTMPLQAPANSGVLLQSGASGRTVSAPTIGQDGMIDGDATALAAATANATISPGTAIPDTVLDPDAIAALAATDPELGAILARTASPKPDLSLRWDESATKDFYDGDLGLRWTNTLGDHTSTPIGTGFVNASTGRAVISIAVTGNDFYIKNSGGGLANYYSRFGSPTQGPQLIVNGTVRFRATRDVALSASLSGTLERQKTMSDRDVMLVAFDNYVPKPADRAVLQLTSTAQYGDHSIVVYQPNIVRQYPAIDAVQDPTVVAEFRAADFTPSPYLTNSNDVVTAYWEGLRGTAIAKLFALPPAHEYFMTTMIRLHSDWANQGGKLPGLANTGQLDQVAGAPLMVNGIDCSPAGWGGRTANGCRWSARTGWSGRVGNYVGLHTYFYAQSPNYGWGYIQQWPTPAPVAQWFAYVERVRVNTPGQADGRLSYWICTQTGCNAQFDRQDIQWRSADFDQTLINEAWADVYCGGLGCPGPHPWPRSTLDLKRMTVTVGLPDMGALLAEVQGLNAAN